MSPRQRFRGGTRGRLGRRGLTRLGVAGCSRRHRESDQRECKRQTSHAEILRLHGAVREPRGWRPSKASRALVRRELGSVHPLRYAALARPGTLLLEDGTGDKVVPRKALENMIHAAPPKTVVRWYPAGHALNARAYDEAFTWLLTKLGVATH